MAATTALRTILIGADHGGFQLKAELAAAFRGLGHKVEEVGSIAADNKVRTRR